ncbi:hypothetical protein ACN28S_43240 [Cystobacter fuscus]
MSAWTHTFTVRARPGGMARATRIIPSRPGGSESVNSDSPLAASSTPRCEVLRRGPWWKANSPTMPASSRHCVSAGTSSNSATNRRGPPGACIHRQRRGS